MLRKRTRSDRFFAPYDNECNLSLETMRRAVRVIIILAGCVIVVFGGAVALLHTPAAKRLVFEQIRKIIAKQGVALEAAEFDYNLLALRISSGPLSVRSTATPDFPSVFSADHLMVEVDIFDVVRGRYRLKDGVITNPKIEIIVDEHGRSNIPTSTGTSGEPIDWLILKLRSTGGSLRYEDRSQNVAVSLPAWDLAVDGNRLTGTQEIQLQTRHAGEARYNGKILPLQNIDVQLALKDRNQTLDVHHVQLSSDVVDVATAGTVENLSQPRLDATVSSTIRLQPASHYLSVENKLEGDLNVDATVTGPPSALKVAGRLNA